MNKCSKIGEFIKQEDGTVSFVYEEGQVNNSESILAFSDMIYREVKEKTVKVTISIEELPIIREPKGIFYGICTAHERKTSIGSVFILEALDEEYYHVLEGNCDAIAKKAITPISKGEYDFLRIVHNGILEKLDTFSPDEREYYEELYRLRNRVTDLK